MINWIEKLICEFRLKRYEKFIAGYLEMQNEMHLKINEDKRRIGWLENLTEAMNERLNERRLDKQELWGHIRILEEQQEIMHNFLVEINKYLVNLADKEKK